MTRSLLTLLLLIISILGFDPLINPASSPEALSLYSYLTSNYGKKILSGQTSFHFQELVQKVGKTPIIQSFDMQNYSPHNPWFNWQPVDDGTVSNAIQWYKSTGGKGIVSFHWHWFSPMGGNLRTSTFYTNYTDFNVSKAVISGTEENLATIRDIDAIAVQLKRLQQARIPILWRPLHEAGGKWFWWGANSAQSCLKLYTLMYQRLTNYHSLNNLIWIWSTPEVEWYPGNLNVDMIGFDSYPGAYNYECRQLIYFGLKSLVGTHKMIMMSENGPIPNFEQCWSMGAKWGYFLSWSDLVFSQNSDEHLHEIYNSDLVVTLQTRELQARE